MLVQPPSGTVLVQPVAEAGPFAEERLVRHLRGSVADRDEARVGEDREHVRGRLVSTGVDVQIGERHTSTDDRVPLAGREAEQKTAGGGLLRIGKRLVGVLGEACDRSLHAPGGAVGLVAEESTLAFAPQLEERSREQGQGARLVAHVGDDRVDERALRLQVGPGCGQLDRPPELGPVHRADEHVPTAEELGEPRIRGAMPVEVRAERDKHEAAPAWIVRGIGERGEERDTLALVGSRGEELLELVDREHEAGLGVQLRERAAEQAIAECLFETRARIGSGSQDRDRPPFAAGQDPAP